MCGIAGYINWKGIGKETGVAEIVGGLRHRGPDDYGFWRSPDGLCELGHTRLSVIDLSSEGHQPMIDPLTKNAIVFNGEIYNFQLLREECEDKGDHFFSRSDTEVILALYRRYGAECLKYLRGMFAFAIWDVSNQQLFLACDRIGKKPLSYALTPNGLILSSEIDPLVHHQEVKKGIDEEALELYLQLQYIPAPWTIYRSIRKLPAAHFAVFNSMGLRVQQYWNVDYQTKLRISEQDALDGLEENLKEAIKLRMIADVPIGALLSGGVDSSLVVAMMASLNGERVKTFSIGFEEDAFNELPYAKVVADRYETDHCTEIVRGEVTSVLDDIVKHYGEPFGDPSAIPSFHVCRTAHKYLKVVMNGDGGDELLGGYPRYWLSPQSIWVGSLLRNMNSSLRLAQLVADLYDGRTIFSRLKRRWILGFAHPELGSFTMYYPFLNDKERGRLLLRDVDKKDSVLARWRETWLYQGMNAGANPIDRMLWIDNRTYLPGDLLVKMDIASMHCGLEARSPLLDHKVIEYCARLPVHLKVKNGTGKYLLKKLGSRYLPPDLLYRRKMGFGIPLSEWLRGRLQPVVREVLFNSKLMEPLDASVIGKIVSEFYETGTENSSLIWVLFMFGLWKKACFQNN
jgi:asparagine synthase (glutamine-hydrolysing)